MEKRNYFSTGVFTPPYKTLTSSVKSTLLICMMICFSSFLRGQQDSLWTAGNRSIDMDNETGSPVSVTLPTSTLADGYSGAVASHATNVQYDEKGNLLFFIIDGRIYDEDGELIADSELDSNCQECLSEGMHDVSIVKRPGTCDQYYIFWGNRIDPEAFTYGLEMAVLDLRVVSDENVDNCGLDPVLINWTSLKSTYGNNNPNHPFYDFINQLFPDGQVTSNPNDPDVSGDSVNPDFGVYGSYHSDSDYLEAHYQVSDYSIPIPVSEEAGNHTTRLDFDIVDGNLAGEKTLFVMTSKRLTVYKITSQGVFFEEDFTTPGNSFESVDWGEGKNQFIAMEAIKHNSTYYVAISDGGVICTNSDAGSYDPDNATGKNLYFLSIDPFDYTIFSQDKIDTHKELEEGKIADLAFSTEGSYLYFNTEYSIDDSEDPFLYYLDIDELLFNGTVDIGSVSTPTLSDYDRLKLASAQIMAHEFNDEPSIYYVNKSGALGYLCVLEGSDDPTSSTYHHDEILLGPISPSSVDGGAGLEDSNNNNLDFYALNKQNFAPQQAEELALEECCEWQDLNQNELMEGYTTAANEDWDADNNPFDTDGENTVTFCDDLVFEDGAHIDITDMTFIFTEDAEMIIEKGANVWLDGSTLTSVCEKMWPGVDLLGTAQADQAPIYGVDQGFLLLEANSVIENAMTAVAVGQNDGFYPPYYYLTNNSGGIIQAKNSTFRNNYRGVVMYPYHNEINGTLYNNFSYFNSCLFETTPGGLYDDLAPRDQLALYEVDGIRVRNCSFQNNASYTTYDGAERGMGVVAALSSFLIEGNGSTSNFVNLFHGINAQACLPYTCRDMIFHDNAYGIYNSYTDNPEIYENFFEIPDKDSKYGVKIPIGVYLTNSTGYKVTRNDLQGIYAQQAFAIGTRVHNSGGDDNYIYKNNFDNLRYGTYVKANNREGSGQRGLQVLCNNYSTGTLDIYVASNSQWKDDQGGYQGSTYGDIQAGNKFSESIPNCSSGQFDVKIHEWNFLTTDYYAFDDPYYIPDCQSFSNHPDPQYDPYDGNSLLEVVNEGIQVSTANCPTNFQGHDLGGHGGHGVVPQNWISRKDMLNDVEAGIADTWNVYHQTVDKDSTEYVIQVLENAYSEESTYVRNLLLQKYPLSKDVLIKLIEEGEYMDDWHLTQIMVANAPLDHEIMHFLIQSELLSEFHLQFIRDADGGDNLRQVLEAELSGLYQERDAIRDGLTRDYLLTFTDSTLSLDSSTVIFKNEYENLWSEYPNHLSRAKMFLREQQPDSALVIVNEIDDQQLRTHWQDFISLSQTTVSTELDSATIAQMETEWLDTSNPLGPVYLGILQANQATDESLDAEFPTSNRSMSMSINLNNNARNEEKGFIGVYPNPADVEVFIEYPVDAQEMESRLEIRNLDGRLIRTIPLKQQNGIVSLFSADWSPGMYLISFIVDGRQMATEKFTVVH